MNEHSQHSSAAPKLVIWGTGGHALVVADIIRLQGDFEIAGFLDDVHPDRAGEHFCGAPVLGGREQLEALRQRGVKHLILGFGDCAMRLRLADLVRDRGFCLASAIHPRAVVAHDVTVGAGTVIAAGAVVNPASRIGSNVIINTCASVDHECVIDDGAHISPGAHLAGRVSVGRATWIGIGATVIDRVRIGAGTVLGAAAVAVRDIPDGVVAYGVPAKPMKRIEARG